MYVVIDNMSVRGFQAMQTPTIVSPAPVFATYMFSHALIERMNGKLEYGFKLHGVSMILHEARMDTDAIPSVSKGGGAYVNEHVVSKRGACGYCIGGKNVGSDMGGDYSSRSVSPFSVASQPSVTASCVVSLILKVSGFDSEEAEELVRTMRFAGGSIDDIGGIRIYENDLPSRLPPGRFFMDARDKVESRLKTGANIVEAMFSRDNAITEEVAGDGATEMGSPAEASVSGNNDVEVEAEDLEESGDSATRLGYVQYMPATLGYALLGDLKPREGARLGPDGEQIPAAPAEAMVGLVGLENVYEVMNSDRNIFWEFNWDNDGDIPYCVIQQQ
ncbi:hypothetical protein [Thiohalobacter thiocyanaticus]|nr:hypothetical protein [Thiohalobacter thiocyanaticus]